jgi:TRAP-type C4-dicarboxylate transport system permease small subunit
MSHATAQLIASLLLIVLIVILRPYLQDSAARFRADLQHWLPVYSAETICHKEAEFIRDHLPRRFPKALVVALCVLCEAAAWWLTR